MSKTIGIYEMLKQAGPPREAREGDLVLDDLFKVIYAIKEQRERDGSDRHMEMAFILPNQCWSRKRRRHYRRQIARRIAIIFQRTAVEVCEHDWKWKSDSAGDHNVINGTMEFSWLECRTCGEECHDQKLVKQYEPQEEYE